MYFACIKIVHLTLSFNAKDLMNTFKHQHTSINSGGNDCHLNDKTSFSNFSYKYKILAINQLHAHTSSQDISVGNKKYGESANTLYDSEALSVSDTFFEGYSSFSMKIHCSM